MTPTGATGPRVLLRQLREVMAGDGLPQQRLDTLTRIIAANMVAEVCSIYLMRPGEVLELCATHGLKPESVHATRLRVGEGIVGDVAAHARPLALSDAQAHPNFAYRPETGEDIFHSMLSVPVVRSGTVIGVLAVQNRTMREYHEEEAEALQTVAMVLAELVISADLVRLADLMKANGNVTLPQRIEGLPLSDGLADGVIVLHEPPVEVHTLIAEDPAAEMERLDAALDALARAIDAMFDDDDLAPGTEHYEILETYRMFSQDRGWLAKIREGIDSGLTADAAVQRVQLETHARMSGMANAYLRERLHDLEDLSNRLLRLLAGLTPGVRPEEMPDNAVVVARSLGPADLLDYDRTRLRAVLLEEGSATEHVAVIARALNIPMVGMIDDALQRFPAGDTVIVDGRQGTVYLRPGDDAYQAYQENLAARDRLRLEYAALRDKPAVTTDGTPVSLQMNAGLLFDLPHLDEAGVDGIGLFRTELQFMVQETFPDVATQAGIYGRVLDAAGARPVIFRTLDIGGDKVLPYLDRPAAREENPAMGWRALRLGLDRPALLRNQLRALLQAAGGRSLRVMFPMVSDVAEFLAARKLLDRELARMREKGQAVPRDLRVGAMLEVPSVVWQLEKLLPHVGFVSIGSNDLMQFFYAVDRSNPVVAARYDMLSPAFLSLIGRIIEQCRAHAVPVGLCGEMAGQPLEAMCLIGLGLRNLSMPATAIGPVKMMVRSLNSAVLAGYLKNLLDSPEPSLRDKLHNFAQDHGFVI